MIQITAQIENELEQIAGKHLPFATSLALNRTAKEARDVVAGNLPKRFKLKRGSIPKTIKAVMSKKNNLMAMVTAPGFLGIHETGGTMNPTSSSALAAKVGGISSRTLRRNQANTFRLDMGNGNAAVFKRTGRKRRGIKLLAWLSQEHEFDERLHMEGDVKEIVQTRFAANFRGALEAALTTSR
jgi:hypothetical protein